MLFDHKWQLADLRVYTFLFAFLSHILGIWDIQLSMYSISKLPF